MTTFRFTKQAEKMLRKIDAAAQERIREKLTTLKLHPNIRSLFKWVIDLDPATHRLRIGEYRLLIRDSGTEEIIVLKIGHRSSIYR